jgi:hypothetical protein
MMTFLLSLVAGRGAKTAGIALAAIAIGGFGFKKGLDFRLAMVEKARAAQLEAEKHAGQQEERAAKAERDYNALRREIAAALEAGRDQAIEQEKQHAQQVEKLEKDASKRVATVLDHTRRMLNAVAPTDGPVRPRPVPQGCPARQLDDTAVQRQLIGRAGQCAAAEERLRALQQFERERLSPADVQP